ncbi:chemotaxis protein CheX [Alkaliphilus transvaalensis]|uniref:chemotaxis protein CheX n=1 Tax=Alkaliphilus transvaalensis TaxID=114628 RepID=UPI00068444B0|nr:chemotaxis protein CheX [Alkaliphilus transvaalensis]
MKEQLVKPFLKALQDILNQITGMSMEIIDTNNNADKCFTKDVAIMIGITGQLEGQTIINLDETLAKVIASNMMGGMTVTELDEISKSAVAELGNMVLGNAAIQLSNEGCIIDITPPTLVTKEVNYQVIENQPIVSTVLQNNFGEIEMNLALKVK